MALATRTTDQPPEPDLDKARKDRFPASDPLANCGITGAEPPDKSRKE